MADIKEAKRFLDLLEPDASFVFRTINANGDGNSVVGKFGDVQRQLVRAEGDGLSVCVTINRQAGVRFIWQLSKPGCEFPCEPSIVVQASDEDVQAYWRCDGLSFAHFDVLMDCEDLLATVSLPGFRQSSGYVPRIIKHDGPSYFPEGLKSAFFAEAFN